MWTMRSEERLHEWKSFRNQLGALPFADALKQTDHLWSFAPFVGHYLDRSTPLDWPTPWELLSDNTYDDTAKALGMLYTLYLSEHGPQHSFSLIIAESSDSLERYNLVSIDEGKYILNFAFDEVISNQQLDPELVIVKQYSADDLQLSKY